MLSTRPKKAKSVDGQRTQTPSIFPLLSLPLDLGASVFEFLPLRECCTTAPACSFVRRVGKDALARARDVPVLPADRTLRYKHDGIVGKLCDLCPKLQCFRSSLAEYEFIPVPVTHEKSWGRVFRKLVQVPCARSLTSITLSVVFPRDNHEALMALVPVAQETFPALASLTVVGKDKCAQLSAFLATVDHFSHVPCVTLAFTVRYHQRTFPFEVNLSKVRELNIVATYPATTQRAWPSEFDLLDLAHRLPYSLSKICISFVLPGWSYRVITPTHPTWTPMERMYKLVAAALKDRFWRLMKVAEFVEKEEPDYNNDWVVRIVCEKEHVH